MDEEVKALRAQVEQLQLTAKRNSHEMHLRKQLGELTRSVLKFGYNCIHNILDNCTSNLHRTFNSEPNYCGIELLDESAKNLVLHSASNIPDLPKHELITPITRCDDGKNSLQHLTLLNKEPVSFGDIHNDPRFVVSDTTAALFPNTKSGISIAIVAGNFNELDSRAKNSDGSAKTRDYASASSIEENKSSLLGRLFIYFTDQHEFSDDEHWFLSHVADLIAEAVSRCKIEQKLSESNERFRILADCSPVLLWMSDTSSLCTWFNEPWLKFRGRTHAEEYGNGWAEGVHPDDYQRCLTIYLTNFKAKKRFEMEYRLMRHDGQYRWIYDTGAPRETASGDFEGFIGSCVDITALKESDKAVLEAKQIEAATAAKNRLLAQFVTDTRENLLFCVPITIRLHGLLDSSCFFDLLPMNQLLLETDLSSEQRNYVEGIQMATELLAELFSDLHDISRAEKNHIQLENVDFKAVDAIEPVIVLIAQTLRFKNQELDLISYIDPKIPKLRGDLIRFKQIILNLISNNISSTGAIYISAEVAQELETKVQLKMTLKHLTGDHKPTEARHHNSSFRPVDEDALGLFIAKQLVNAMGGDIVYCGEDDLICRVRIWLKKAPQTIDTDTPPETPTKIDPFLEEDGDSSDSDDNSTQSSGRQSAPVSNKEIRILIVDPLSVVVDAIATYLRTVPRYTCQTATSINEAVKLITNSFETKTPFDLILLDFKQETLGRFMMQSHPKMFKRTKWVPILFSQDNYKLNNVEWEWTSAIYKPIRMNNLLETVSLTLMGLDNTAGYSMRNIKRSDAKV